MRRAGALARSKVLALVAALTAAASGCASVPETRYYTLSAPGGATGAGAAERGAPGDAAADGAPPGLTVVVRSFAVDPPYDQDQVIYRLGADGSEVGFYAYHRWAAPLSRLLPLAVARAFEGTPGLASITPASVAVSTAAEADAYLDGRLLYLEEVDAAAGLGARVGLELTLSAPGGVPLWRGRVAGEAKAGEATVPEVVELMRAALGEALAEARASLAAALGARAEPAPPP